MDEMRTTANDGKNPRLGQNKRNDYLVRSLEETAAQDDSC